jgi:hypothetical protein
VGKAPNRISQRGQRTGGKSPAEAEPGVKASRCVCVCVWRGGGHRSENLRVRFAPCGSPGGCLDRRLKNATGRHGRAHEMFFAYARR